MNLRQRRANNCCFGAYGHDCGRRIGEFGSKVVEGFSSRDASGGKADLAGI